MSMCKCVFMCAGLCDFDKDIQHKTILLLYLLAMYTRSSIQQIHKNYSTKLCNPCDLTLENEFKTHCCWNVANQDRSVALIDWLSVPSVWNYQKCHDDLT